MGTAAPVVFVAGCMGTGAIRRPSYNVFGRGNRCKKPADLRPAIIATFGANMRKRILFLGLLLLSTFVAAQQYDLVIEGGRVIDPETAFDAVRTIGIRAGKIAPIAATPLSGRRVIHATDLVVAPGFIDLHQHAQDLASQRVKAFDGVTPALEMEIGPPPAHPATPEQIERMQQRLRDQLDAGALGVGMGIEYAPGASRLEVIDMFRVAAERKLPVYTHMRSAGRVDPGSAIQSVEEVIGAAAITGASLHIVHVNSTCLRDSLECISMIEGARARGLDVTTEAYPYIAGMTAINSALFNPGWREKLGIDDGDLVLPESGEHLTKERFDELHNSKAQQFVLVFANTQEIVDAVIPNPLIMIASDGLEGHPRNAGTYSRILAQYVREKKTL